MDFGSHHLNLRKRLYKNLESYPHPESFKRFFDKLMYVVSIGGALALLPQVIQVYTTHDARDLSFMTWALLGFFNILWVTYGVIHKAPPIIWGSAVSGLLQFSLVYAIFAFS